MVRSCIGVLLLALWLGGCDEPPATPSAPEPASDPDLSTTGTTAPEPSLATPETVTAGWHYRCDDGTRFDLFIDGADATLLLEQQVHELRRQPAASGMFLSGEHWQLHHKGQQALLIGAEDTRACQPGDAITTPVSE